ncbi:MAG: hypothetical protein JOS17DRAFT_293867 [Linnemannia elongata]|nr:MAG: hypothetical protein JOS17DRAFT_293867 [Linnemannia elongata]
MVPTPPFVLLFCLLTFFFFLPFQHPAPLPSPSKQKHTTHTSQLLFLDTSSVKYDQCVSPTYTGLPLHQQHHQNNTINNHSSRALTSSTEVVEERCLCPWIRWTAIIIMATTSTAATTGLLSAAPAVLALAKICPSNRSHRQ